MHLVLHNGTNMTFDAFTMQYQSILRLNGLRCATHVRPGKGSGKLGPPYGGLPRCFREHLGLLLQ